MEKLGREMVQSAIKNRKGALVYRRITHRVIYFDLLVEIENVPDVQFVQENNLLEGRRN